MYNDDTRKEYRKISFYLKEKFGDISREELKNKFTELLETDDEFKKMIDEFNKKSVYNKDAIKGVDDYLSLGEKLFSTKEGDVVKNNNSKKDTERKIIEPFKLKMDSNSSKTVNKTDTKLPFYKKAFNFVKNMPDAVKFVNGVSLGVFGTLTLFNAIGGGGLFYVGAVLGLPIPAITATVYAGRAIYKSYKNGKIRQWLNRNKAPFPTFEKSEEKEKSKSAEPIVESKINDKDIFFPSDDIEEEHVNVEPFPEVKPKDEVPPVPEFKRTKDEPKINSDEDNFVNDGKKTNEETAATQRLMLQSGEGIDYSQYQNNDKKLNVNGKHSSGVIKNPNPNYIPKHRAGTHGKQVINLPSNISKVNKDNNRKNTNTNVKTNNNTIIKNSDKTDKNNFSQRRIQTIQDLEKSMSSLKINKNEMANYERIISETEKYLHTHDKSFMETAEYKEALVERENAIKQLDLLRKKQTLYEESERQLRDLKQNVERSNIKTDIKVNTNDGEKTIYVAPNYNIRETITYDDKSSTKSK